MADLEGRLHEVSFQLAGDAGAMLVDDQDGVLEDFLILKAVTCVGCEVIWSTAVPKLAQHIEERSTAHFIESPGYGLWRDLETIEHK